MSRAQCGYRTPELTVHERVFGQLGEGVEFEIDIQLRPEQVMAVKQLDIENVADTGFPKPREILMSQKVFPVLHPQPNPVG